MQFLKVSRGKYRRFFPAGPFFFVFQMIVHKSALIPTNLPCPKNFTVTRLLFYYWNVFYYSSLLKMKLQHRCFLVNFAKFLKTFFYRTPTDDCFRFELTILLTRCLRSLTYSCPNVLFYTLFSVDIPTFLGVSKMGTLAKNELSIEAVSRRCSVKMIFLRISPNSVENTWARVSFYNKVAGWGIQLY